ncbi:MAG: hypothetical protein Q9227_000793 [Pyrenula ochraceoflavens]
MNFALRRMSTRLDPRNAPLPTRCVDIQDSWLKICESEGTNGAYITLSHRWNEATERCKTTTGNYAERRDHISLDSLSETFKDAILVTRRLGIRFIWIDSLCIIQTGDGGADWNKEAPKMGQYYQYSLLTLAVTAGTPDLGFLSPRMRKPFTFLARLPYREKDDVQKGHFYVYKNRTHVDESFLSGVWNSDLLKRGWVFQEWMLSRRVVYYTPSQVFFECQARPPSSECGETIGLRHLPSNLNKDLGLKSNILFLPSSIETTFYEIVQAYSRLNFTQAVKDRILALSGITDQIKEVFTLRDDQAKESRPLEYVSGLWLRDIHYGLLWHQKATAKEYVRISSLPSWSWASLMIEVEWHNRWHRTQNVLRVLGLILVDGTEYPVDVSNSDSPSSSAAQLLHQPTSENPSLGSMPNNTDNSIKALSICAPLHPLVVRGPLDTKANVRLAAWATGVDLDSSSNVVSWLASQQANDLDPATLEAALGLDFASKPWRAICSTTSPDIIGGWGSFEIAIPGPAETTEEEDSSSSSGSDSMVVQALHVSTEKGLPGGLAFGKLSLSHDVLNLLFVRENGRGGHERIGVGKLFDTEMIREISKGGEQYVVLV